MLTWAFTGAKGKALAAIAILAGLSGGWIATSTDLGPFGTAERVVPAAPRPPAETSVADLPDAAGVSRNGAVRDEVSATAGPGTAGDGPQDGAPAARVAGTTGPDARDAPPAAAAAPDLPRFDIVRVEPDGSALIAGRAAPGARVAILLDGNGMAREVADDSGNFVAMLDIAPSAQARVLSLEAGTAAGPAERSQQTVILTPSAEAILARSAGPDGPADRDATIEPGGAGHGRSASGDAGSGPQPLAPDAVVAALPTRTDLSEDASGPTGRPEAQARPTPRQGPQAPGGTEAAGGPRAGTDPERLPGSATEAPPDARHEDRIAGLAPQDPGDTRTVPLRPAQDAPVAGEDRQSRQMRQSRLSRLSGPETGAAGAPVELLPRTARRPDPEAAPLADRSGTSSAGAAETSAEAAGVRVPVPVPVPVPVAPVAVPGSNVDLDTVSPGSAAPAASVSAPIETARRDAPIETTRRDAPIETARRDAPIETTRRDAPIETARRDAPIETTRRDAPIETARRDAPRVLVADEAGVRVLQDSGAAPEVHDGVVIDTISYDDTGAVVLSGRGTIERSVRVYLDNAVIGTSRIGDDGQWRADLPKVDARVYTLRVDEIEEDGRVLSRMETPFRPEEAEKVTALADEAGDRPRATVVTVQPGFTLWRIARDSYGEGLLYVRVFEANADKIRDPDLIYPGQIFAVPQ